jgi:hypothetical protein
MAEEEIKAIVNNIAIIMTIMIIKNIIQKK